MLNDAFRYTAVNMITRSRSIGNYVKASVCRVSPVTEYD